jgi:hypothetical protein
VQGQQWFALKPRNKALADRDEIKRWFAAVSEELLGHIMSSNFPRAVYEGLQDFVTMPAMCLYLEEGGKEVLNFQAFAFGSYVVKDNADGIVDTIYRAFKLTPRQAVQKWGKEALHPKMIEALNDDKKCDTQYDFLHYVAPRENYDESKKDKLNMPFASCYIDVKHKHGSPGADVTLRVSQSESVELAPCFRVASSSGSTITLFDNAFSFDDGLPPFDTDTSPPYDGQWFNYDRHGAGLRITVWEQGNYAGAQTYTVTGSAFSGGNWTLTLSASFSATLAGIVTTGNVPVIGTFAPYANAMSPLRSQYAYIGSNDRPSVLGSLDGTLDDVEANRWR